MKLLDSYNRFQQVAKIEKEFLYNLSTFHIWSITKNS